MKCLSLWQPWATLIAIGAKSIETRSWETAFRGRLAIHAAKKWTDGLYMTCCGEPFYSALSDVFQPSTDGKRTPRPLPLGCIVAVATLHDCRRVWQLSGGRETGPVGLEREFGDYTPGRFMWVLRNVVALPQPIPCVGRQGLFDVPDELLAGRVA